MIFATEKEIMIKDEPIQKKSEPRDGIIQIPDKLTQAKWGFCSSYI
jgi:hypothetical protein